ncbi:MAG: serine/threonine-protein kinase [Pirellulaceae bacterium]|nr:serine/threonine-protein kinase [Pirellulaceae bacterium]
MIAMDRTSSEQNSERISCHSRDRLRQYLAGWTDDLLSDKIEVHLSTCNSCEMIISEIEQESDRLLVQPGGSSEEPIEQVPLIAQALNAVKNRTVEASIDEQPIVEPLSPMVPQNNILGPYLLLEPIGRGGMGTVYLARHRKLNKQVAIKLLPMHFVDKSSQARFEREILAAGQLQHPGIVLATDAGQAEGLQYLVMEYVRGFDLGRLIRVTPPVSIADVCEIGRQIALGLSFAHAAGMVHRDIKPSNVMLDETGTIKILDFGLVMLDRWDGISSELTTIGQFLGTLDYMAPEQAERCGAVDYRADLYSLGATLFRLLCGRAPLAAAPNQSPLEKLRLLANHRPPSLKTLRPDAPADLVRLVDQLLATNPTDRPASAAHVAEQLQPLATEANLVTLLNETRKSEVESPTSAITSAALPTLRVAPQANVSGSGRGNQTFSRWLAATCLPLFAFAGYWIVLETSKGQLVIDSEVADVQVKILRNGEPIKDLTIQPGSTSTRLTADRYEIIINSPSDALSIDKETFILKNGQTIIARLTNKTTTNPLLPSPRLRGEGSGVRGEAREEPIYDGKTYDEWFHRLKIERSTTERPKIYDAIRTLRTPEHDVELNAYVLELFRSQPNDIQEYLYLLTAQPVTNLRPMLNIIERDITGYSRVLYKLIEFSTKSMMSGGNESVENEWNPLWDWLSKTVGKGEPVGEICESELRNYFLIGGGLDDIYSGYSMVSRDQVRTSLEERYRRVLEISEVSNRFRKSILPRLASALDIDSSPEIRWQIQNQAQQLIEDQSSDEAHICAGLASLNRMKSNNVITDSDFSNYLDKSLTRMASLDLLFSVDAEFFKDQPFKYFEFPNDIHEIASHITFSIDQAARPAFIAHIFNYVRTLHLNERPLEGLRVVADSTKLSHDKCLAALISEYSRQKNPIFIAWPILSQARYNDGAKLTDSETRKIVYFMIHRWANQLLGTPLPDPFATIEKSQSNAPLLPSPRLRGEGSGVRGEAPSTNPHLASKEQSRYGRTYDEWLNQLRNKGDSKAWLEAFRSIHKLTTTEQRKELNNEVFLLAVKHRQLSDYNLCSSLATWTSPDELAKQIIANVEKSELSELSSLLPQIASPIVKLSLPFDVWDPVWKYLEALQFDPKKPEAIDDEVLQSLFSKLVSVSSSTTSFKLSLEFFDRAKYILDHFPNLSRRYLVYPMCVALHRRDDPSVATLDKRAIHDWANASAAILLEHILAVFEDDGISIPLRLRMFDVMTDDELANVNVQKVLGKSTSDMLQLASQDLQALASRAFKPTRSMKTNPFRRLVVLDDRAYYFSTNPSMATRKVYEVLLAIINSVPESMRRYEGLDAAINATKESHDRIRKKLIQQLELEDLSLTQFDIRDSKKTIWDPRNTEANLLKSIEITDEMLVDIDIYMCHRWANELRGTPTADSSAEVAATPRSP